MKRKKVKQLILAIGTFCFLLIAILALHIYNVTHKGKADQLQLSRIDFLQDVDSVEAIKIRAFVQGLPGVKNTYFNIPGGILVYTYAIGKQSSLNVYSSLMKHGHYKAERYMVAAEKVAEGCPAFTNKGLSAKLSSFIKSL